MSVFDNIVFGLKVWKVLKVEIGWKVREFLEVFGIFYFFKRKLKILSGGEM